MKTENASMHKRKKKRIHVHVHVHVIIIDVHVHVQIFSQVHCGALIIHVHEKIKCALPKERGVNPGQLFWAFWPSSAHEHTCTYMYIHNTISTQQPQWLSNITYIIILCTCTVHVHCYSSSLNDMRSWRNILALSSWIEVYLNVIKVKCIFIYRI